MTLAQAIQDYDLKCEPILAALQRGPQKSNDLFRTVPEYKVCISYLRGKGHRIRDEKSGLVTLYTWDGFQSADEDNGRLIVDFNAEFAGRAQAVALTPDDDGQWTFYLVIPNLPPLSFQAPSLPAAVDLARRFLTNPDHLPSPFSFHAEHRSNSANHEDK